MCKAEDMGLRQESPAIQHRQAYVCHLACCVGSFLGVWLVFEVLLRALTHTWTVQNFSGYRPEKIERSEDFNFDARLGWAPQPPGVYQQDLISMTILADGIRSNGTSATMNAQFQMRPPILAVGDSFTVCPGVADSQTWPAQLERLTGKRVLNAGVGGYGLDQSFLRAEQLVPIYHPDMVIVSFTPAGIDCVELALRGGVKKPYFEITDDGNLVYVAADAPRPVSQQQRLIRSAFGYSYAAHVLMARLYPVYWYEGQRVHQRGVEVSCLLLKRFAALAEQKHFKVVVLNQDAKFPTPEEITAVDTLFQCLDGVSRMYLLNLRQAFREAERENSASYANLFQDVYGGHMTAAGNQFIAEQVFAFLQTHRLITP